MIQSNMKEVEWSQAYLLFFRRSMADNSVESGGIWPKFKLIQAFTHALDTCKNEKDLMKNEVTRVATTFSHYKSMVIFFRRPRAGNCSPCSDLAEF